jgi:hypothetical protein
MPNFDFDYFKVEDISLEEIMDEYSEYITDKEKVVEIFKQIKNLNYINAGYVFYEEWKHKKHIFIINGETFEYKTGVGIDCQKNSNSFRKNNGYVSKEFQKALNLDFTKLLFDAVYCFIQESNTALNYSENDFLEEFGYTESVKMYKEGIIAYNTMQINCKKALKIWDRDIIDNIFDIVQL